MRQKKDKREGRWKNLFLLLSIVLLFLLFFYERKLYAKDYYEMEPRVDQVSQYVLDDANGNDLEVIGWLRVQGTDIDVPVLFSPSFTYDFPVELENYVWSVNFDKEFHNMLILSGHNIFNLSSKPLLKSDRFQRFEELMSFVYYNFAKDNEYIQLTLDGKEYLYKIFSVNFVSANDQSSFPVVDHYTKEEMEQHVAYLRENSLYDYDVDVNGEDDVLTLTTCSRFFGVTNQREFFVSARLVREGEKVAKYNVSKSTLYQEVEDVLNEGDDDDEMA